MGFNLHLVEVCSVKRLLYINSNSPSLLTVLPCFSSLFLFQDWMPDLQWSWPQYLVALLGAVSPAFSLSSCWHIASTELRDIYHDCTLLPNQTFFESRTSAVFCLTLLASVQFSVSSGRIFVFEKWCLCMLPELKTIFYSRQSSSSFCLRSFQWFSRSCKLCNPVCSLIFARQEIILKQ